MFWLGFFFFIFKNHGQTLGSLFSFHLAEAEYVKNCNQCYLRAGIPPNFPFWGADIGKKKLFLTHPSLVILHSLVSALSRRRCHRSNKQTLCTKMQNLKLWDGQGLELSSARRVLESPDLPVLILMDPWKFFQMLHRLFFKDVNFI